MALRIHTIPRAAVPEDTAVAGARCLDRERGECGAADRGRYLPLAVEADDDEIRVGLPCP
jgi:hypothetical protein